MKVTTLLITILIICSAVTADEYKDFNYSRKQVDYFSIRYDKDSEQITITGHTDTGKIVVQCSKKDLELSNETVTCNNQTLFDNKGLYLKTILLPYDSVSDTRIYATSSTATITFLKRTSSSRLYSFKQGNLIELTPQLAIQPVRFIRGIVFNPVGDIDISGEVNKDVISLFGNIRVFDDASVRGDIFTLAGKVKVETRASVYGEIYEPYRDNFGSIHNTGRTGTLTSVGEHIVYNRVDGLYLGVNFKYLDYDSLYPTIDGEVGYGFASERFRMTLGLKQVLLRKPALSVGARYFKQLQSEDDWLLDHKENTFFALLFTEDYKDYYESHGGTVFAEMKPTEHIDVNVGYTYYETNWLRAYRVLWSLIGGDKLFDPNFGSVDPAYRTYGTLEIDSTENGYLSAEVNYSTYDDEWLFEESSWRLSAKFELADSKLNSDFDYSRYLFTVNRHQQINRHTTLLARIMFGNSDGYLPMYKRFYLGGIGSLHGYQFKEYIGTRFWMSNLEYRFEFPGSDIAFSMIWDMGQIANDRKLNGDVEWKQSLGFSLYMAKNIKFTLSKRLDRSENDYPKFYFRINQTF